MGLPGGHERLDILCSQCRGPGLIPGQGIQSPNTMTNSLQAAMKIKDPGKPPWTGVRPKSIQILKKKKDCRMVNSVNKTKTIELYTVKG